MLPHEVPKRLGKAVKLVESDRVSLPEQASYGSGSERQQIPQCHLQGVSSEYSVQSKCDHQFDADLKRGSVWSIIKSIVFCCP